jgi:hypothetical protein
MRPRPALAQSLRLTQPPSACSSPPVGLRRVLLAHTCRRRRRARPCLWPAVDVYAPATIFSTTPSHLAAHGSISRTCCSSDAAELDSFSAIHTPNAARQCHAERAATFPSRHQHLHGVALPTACRPWCWVRHGKRSGVCPASGISALSNSPRLVAGTCPQTTTGAPG